MWISLVLSALAIYFTYHLYHYLLLTYQHHVFARSRGCQPVPRYPQKDPIFGIDLVINTLRSLKVGGAPQLVVRRFATVGANTYKSDVMGMKFLHTIEPENVKAILATQFDDFAMPALRKMFFGPVFGYGIFANNGHEWATSRAMLRPNFNRAQVADLDALEGHMKKFIARIPKDGSTFDIQDLFFSLTMDSATEFLFGHSSNTLDTGAGYERGAKFSKSFTDAVYHTGVLARAPSVLHPFLRNKRFVDDTAYIHEYISEYVQKAVDMHKNGSKKSEKYVFLEELAATGQTREKIQAELMNILLAGRDTTAGLLSFLFWILAREKNVFAKLKAEVDTLEGKLPGYETIKNMKYLQWTLNEALRLFPAVPLNAREATRDTTLPVGGGPDGKSPVFVFKGQLVNYQAYVMHRRKDIYGEDADEFRPERWEDLRPGWAYVPFNGGPRICIGQQYALIEASYTTIRILQNFSSIEPRDDEPLREFLTLTISVMGGVKIAVRPR